MSEKLPRYSVYSIDGHIVRNCCAYPSRSEKDKWLTFKNPRIRIGTGRHEWGAEPGKNYFVITWEK